MAVPATLEVVSFVAAGCRFAVEARRVDALLNDTPATAVDIETLLGLSVAPVARRRCLRSAGRWLRVSEPVELRALAGEQIFPLPELVARRMCIKGACALALAADGATVLLDLHALLA